MSNPNKKLIAAPAFPGMLIKAVPVSEGFVRVLHIGCPGDLVASGVATAEMLLPGKRGRSDGRVDWDGIRFFLERYFVTRDDQPVRRCRVLRPCVSRDKALQLPGVAEALQAHARQEAAEELRCEELEARHARMRAEETARQSTAEASPKKIRSHLRLVVDNTREVRPD